MLVGTMRVRILGPVLTSLCLVIPGRAIGQVAPPPASGRVIDNQFPHWSPDGRQIVFTSDRDGDPEIYVVNADGSDLRRLTSVPGRDAHPSFSRDGKRIVFQSPRDGGDTNVYVMNLDGSGQTRLECGRDRQGQVDRVVIPIELPMMSIEAAALAD